MTYYPTGPISAVPPSVPAYSLTLEQMRVMVRQELEKALHPEYEARLSATVEYIHDGKRWKGTVYLVDEEEKK